jgi:hemerythrin
MSVVDLEKIPQVPLAFVNDDHREEARLLNDLADAVRGHRDGKVAVETVIHRYDALLDHTREHFAREEDAMRRTGFPPYPMHKAEHERVLEDMESEAQHFRETGDTARLWTYVADAVPSWFIAHIQSMDHVTASFVAARGG